MKPSYNIAMPRFEAPTTLFSKVGHRYVTQYQLRVRMKGETHKVPLGVNLGEAVVDIVTNAKKWVMILWMVAKSCTRQGNYW